MNTKERIIKARIQLILNNAFFGNLLLNLKLKESKDVKTFAVDQKHLYYNVEFADSLNDQHLQFVLCHEVMHLVLMHLTRRNERNHIKWNYAIDYATNLILKNEFEIPDNVLYDEKFKGMTAEQIYNLLPENPDGEGSTQYDEHKDIEGNTSEVEEIEQDWKVNVSKAYNISKQAGKLSGNMDILINGLLNPKLDWKSLLRQYVNTKAKNDYNWLRPNKRFIHKNLYMPSLYSEALGEVVVIVDNSGSTQEYQQQFISECNGMLSQYDMNLHLITVDTTVNSYKVYSKYDKIDLQYKGSGGTDIRKAFEFFKDKKINPNVIVCLTDGYTKFPDKSFVPILWILTENKDVPFGQKVVI